MVTFHHIRHSKAIEEYFSSPDLTAEEREGQWIGRGCASFGFVPLSATTQKDFANALNGYSPSGLRLFQRRRQEDRRSGFDFTFSGDKSISIAALCLTKEEHDAIINAFKNAAREAWEIADRCAADDAEPSAKNLVAAQFIHHASRHNDPHLHAHTVTLNLCLNSLGRPRRLNTLGLLKARKAIDDIFQHLLGQKLILAGFAVVKNTAGKVVLPIAKFLCDELSKAHCALRQALKTVSRPPAFISLSQKQWATILNDRIRPAKSKHPDFNTLLNVNSIAILQDRIRARKPVLTQSPQKVASQILRIVHRTRPIPLPFAHIIAAADVIRARPPNDVITADELEEAISKSRKWFTPHIQNDEEEWRKKKNRNPLLLSLGVTPSILPHYGKLARIIDRVAKTATKRTLSPRMAA